MCIGIYFSGIQCLSTGYIAGILERAMIRKYHLFGSMITEAWYNSSYIYLFTIIAAIWGIRWSHCALYCMNYLKLWKLHSMLLFDVLDYKANHSPDAYNYTDGNGRLSPFGIKLLKQYSLPVNFHTFFRCCLTRITLSLQRSIDF